MPFNACKPPAEFESIKINKFVARTLDDFDLDFRNQLGLFSAQRDNTGLPVCGRPREYSKFRMWRNTWRARYGQQARVEDFVIESKTWRDDIATAALFGRWRVGAAPPADLSLIWADTVAPRMM
jgi:hypothetical protein